jgi:uncharacterized protein (TIGR03437 family)
MARHFVQILFAFLIASRSFAQPVISSPTSIVNSASYRTPGLPASGIAQGSIFTIRGTGLGPNPWVTAGPLPYHTNLAGTSVSVKVGGTSVDAFILLAYNYQVNAILPSVTPIGSGSVTVTYNGQPSAPQPIQVVASAFGIYTFNSAGFGQAIATDLNYQVNTIIKTFHPGDWVILWGTGLGPIDGSDANAPPVGTLPGPVTVHVGNSNVPPYYAGRSGSYPGLDQMIFQIPSGVQGCYVPVAVETSGGVSNIPTIAVSTAGQTCSDSILGQDLVDKLAAGNNVNFGYVRLESLFAKLLYLSATQAQDFVYASFTEFTPQTAGLAVYGISSGYCVAGDNNGALGFSDMGQGQLDAGTLTVQGQGTMTVPNTYGFYRSYGNGSKFLWSGLDYAVSTPGGKDVDGFSVSETTSVGGANFSGITPTQTVPLSSDFTVRWTGGDPKMQNGEITIIAYSLDSSQTLFGALQCTAPLSAGSFTIPRWVLSKLPPTGTGQAGTLTYPLGWIQIGQYNKPVTFQAKGLDRGLLTDAFFNGFGVYFQ